MRRPLSLTAAATPLLMLILAAMLSVFIWDTGMHIPLLVGTIAAAIVAVFHGWKWKEVEKMMANGVSRALPAIFILLIIGTIIGTWIASGIIPTIIYYGLSMIHPSWFVPVASIITGIVSITLGSSFTSIATIGIAFMAIGDGLGFSPGLVAGAIISGAFFGDKLSPASDTTNIASVMAETDLFSHVKHMLWDTLPAFFITIMFYGIISNSDNVIGTVDTSVITELKTGLTNAFVIHPLLLLIPVLAIILLAMRTPAIPALIGISMLGAILAIPVQKYAVGDIVQIMTNGFTKESGSADLDALLHHGGLLSMMDTIGLIILATALGGVLEKTGAFEAITRRAIDKIKTTGSLITATILSTFIVALASGEQYLSNILPARTFVQKYKDMRLATKNLSRCTEAAGTVGITLVPWSIPTVFAANIFHLNPGQFLPFAFFVFLVPLINILFGFTGWTIAVTYNTAYRKNENAG
ncbi:MAG TPA: Na+/H+ antiporter NhaC [Bacillota bacterium]|nr:Na+/H+ antiporter NhaC [Bacillota bacterium]